MHVRSCRETKDAVVLPKQTHVCAQPQVSDFSAVASRILHAIERNRSTILVEEDGKVCGQAQVIPQINTNPNVPVQLVFDDRSQLVAAFVVADERLVGPVENQSGADTAVTSQIQ